MSLRRSLAWTALAQGLFFVIQYGGSIVLARLLSPREMGVYAIALATIGLLGILQAMGLNSYIVRHEQLTPERLGTAFGVNALINLFVAAVVLLIAPLAGHYMNDDGVRRVMTALALAPLLGALEFPAGALMHRDMRFKPLAVIQVVKAAVTAGVTLYGASVGWSTMSLAYGTLAGGFVGLVIITALARPHRHLRLSLAHWREVTRFGSQMMAIGGVTGLAAKAPDFMIGRMLGLAPLGIYGRATGIVGLVWDNIYAGMTRVMMPSLAEHHRRGGSLRPVYGRTLELMTGFFWPAFGGLAIMAGPLIHFMYGDQWGQAAPILSVLCIAQLVGVSMTMSWEVFVVKNEVGRQARFEFWRALVGAVLFFIGVQYGLLAAAASRVVDMLVAVAFYGPAVARMTDMTLQDFLAAYRRSALLLAASILPPALLMHGEHWRHDISVSYLLACIGSAVLAWLAAAFLIRHPLAEEISRLVASAYAKTPVGRSACS